MDEHSLIVALKQLALELGQTPTRDQFCKHVRNGRHYAELFFGSYSKMVNAAGLAPTIGRNKVTNKIFEVDIDRHLSEYKPTQIQPRELWPKIAILGDLHEPFAHDKVKSDFVLFCKKHQPDYIIQIGDSFDFYSHSRFAKSHNIFTPQDEEKAARKKLEELWSSLRRSCPNAKMVHLLGNHNARPLKQVLESAPNLEHWVEKYFKELMTFDGVHTILDPREEYLIKDIAFIHGYRGKLGDHRDYMLMNVCRGHDHVGGVVYRQLNDKVIWELDVGFAGDYNSKGFTYTQQKMTKWTLGWGYIDEYGPRFIPL